MATVEGIPAPKKKTELKVRAASWASFLASLAGLTLLTSTVTDAVPALPDWLEVPAYALVSSAITWLAGCNTRTKPDNLSPSTVEALKEWMRKRAPRVCRCTRRSAALSCTERGASV